MPTKKNRAAYMRTYRARKREAAAPAPVALGEFPENPAEAFSIWCSHKLKVPPGHPLAGQPFVLAGLWPSFHIGCLDASRELALSRAKEREKRHRGRLPFGAPGRASPSMMATGAASPA